jgi:hypothetical protein
VFSPPGPRGLIGIVCLAALTSFTNACKKHRTITSIPITIPPASAPSPPKHRRAHNPVSSSPAPTVTSKSASPDSAHGEAPRLGQMLSSSEQQEYNAAIDQSLIEIRNTLGPLGNRNLTPAQQSSVREIQELIRQVNATRKVDLASAKALADKAQVLSRDLARDTK